MMDHARGCEGRNYSCTCGYDDATADHIEALEGKVERLREVLSRWQYSGCPHCSGDCGSANPPVTSCIMEETRAALGEKQ